MMDIFGTQHLPLFIATGALFVGLDVRLAVSK